MAVMSSMPIADVRQLQTTAKSNLIAFDPIEEVGFDPHQQKQSLLAQKRAFTFTNFSLSSGLSLEWVQFGYECFGRLNEACDNAILIPHYFTGSSHIAGKYTDSDPELGYWDSLIGPGRAIDTDRYFVIGVDSLCNVNALNPFVVSTGPTSVNPETQRAYGRSFPWINLTDSVRAHRRLIDALGIRRLKAVIGPSMGSMSALEWAAEFPEMVGCIIGVIGGSFETPAYLVQELRQWCLPILLDPDFQDGKYRLEAQPRRGLAATLEQVTHSARSPAWAAQPPMIKGGQFQFSQFEPRTAIETLFSTIGYERSAFADANSFLRTARAVQMFSVRQRARRMQCRALWIHAENDLLSFPSYALEGVQEMRTLGLKVESQVLPGSGGHLDGIFEIQRVGDTIGQFLDKAEVGSVG